MKAALRIALIAACFMTPANAARADWKPVERTETYAISGKTGIALYRSIGEKGPKVGVGRAIAFTNFDLKWSRDYVPKDGGCTLVSARPHLIITYLLPKPSADLPAATRKLWETFIEGVRAHERVHGEIITDITRKIEAVSIGLTMQDDPDCNKTRAELQRLLVPIAAELKQRSRDFDRTELSEGGNVHQLVLGLVNGG